MLYFVFWMIGLGYTSVIITPLFVIIFLFVFCFELHPQLLLPCFYQLKKKKKILVLLLEVRNGTGISRFNFY